VFFQPKISKLIYIKNKPLKWLWDLTAVSIAAQIGTFPFILYYFHQFPNYFLLTNYVAIPISTVIIYLAIALLFLSKIPILSTVLAFLLKWSLWLMNWLIAAIQNLPGSISVISIDGLQLVLVFTFIIAITAFFYHKKISSLTVGLVSLLLVLSIYNYQKYNSLNNSKMIVFSDSRVPIVNFIERGNNYVFTTDSIQAAKTASSFWKSNLLKKPIYLKDENSWFANGFVSFRNKRILILKDDLLKNKTVEKPLELDYLILSNKIKPKMEEILACVQPKKVIIDKSISKWYTNHIEEVCKRKKIQYYSIAENGAYVVNLTR
jgi:competence protein ComEC